ncbi:MAG TPA: shikimate kinase [Thermodesulfovibrionales bacterium]|nr:shikimate kinase [Thermodesulfovibrionales bacterium]
MKNIVLTGFMGTGKTEVGRELSHILGWRLIDLDDEIVKAKGMSINQIFSAFGEPAFRDIETEMIREISMKKSIIVSTGGGAVLRKENIDMLREQGVIVNLSATPETVVKRTSGNDERPLLRVEDPLGRIRELLEFRRPFYENADVLIDTESKTPLRVAEEILERIGWKR